MKEENERLERETAIKEGEQGESRWRGNKAITLMLCGDGVIYGAPGLWAKLLDFMTMLTGHWLTEECVRQRR